MSLAQEVSTHGAVCIERTKMLLNTLASIELQLSKLDEKMLSLSADMHNRIDSVRTSTSKRLDGWLTAIAAAGITATCALAMVIMTRGLK